MKSTRAGVSLIELVVVIVVIGVAIPALLSGWATISWRSLKAESLADAAAYGQALMEEVLSRRFDDLDDYHGFSQTLPAGYLANVSVSYMSLSGSAWQQSAAVSDYKRVRVQVVRSGKAGADIALETLVGAP